MHRVRTGDPVEEDHPVGVVDLVLQGHGLEGVGLDRHPPPRAGQLARLVVAVDAGTS